MSEGLVTRSAGWANIPVRRNIPTRVCVEPEESPTDREQSSGAAAEPSQNAALHDEQVFNTLNGFVEVRTVFACTYRSPS